MCYCGSKNCRGLMGAKDEKVAKDDVAGDAGKKGGKQGKRGRKRKQKIVKQPGELLLEDMSKPIGPRIRKTVQQRHLILIRNLLKVRKAILGGAEDDAGIGGDEAAQGEVEDDDDDVTNMLDDTGAHLRSLVSGPAQEAFKTKLMSLKTGGGGRRTRTLADADANIDVDRCAQLVHILLGVHEMLLKETNEDGRKLAKPFLKLPSEKRFPDYYTQIKNPIELLTIEEELSEGESSCSAAWRLAIDIPVWSCVCLVAAIFPFFRCHPAAFLSWIQECGCL